MAVPVLTRECPLGAGLAGNCELLPGEPLPPFGVGAGELVSGNAGHLILLVTSFNTAIAV